VIPLSYQQEFACLFDRGDGTGPFGPRYTIVGGWHASGRYDERALQHALHDVVVRHEALRTRIVRDSGPDGGRDGGPDGGRDGGRDGGAAHQLVLAASPPQLSTLALPGDPGPQARDLAAQKLLNEIEEAEFPIDSRPLLRAVVARFDESHWLLILVAHHTAVDGWSIQLIMRDLAVLYARRRGLDAGALPAVAQYRDYAIWQRSQPLQDPAVVRRAQYWREKLDGAMITPISTDRLRSAGTPFVTAWYRYLIDADTRSAMARAATALHSSPFMVLAGVLSVLHAATTGRTDVVVPTFSSGRGESWTHDIVGSLFNLVPLRTEIAGCRSLRDVVIRIRSTCLEAYANELPFALVWPLAPDLMAPAATDGSAALVFQVVQSPFIMHGDSIGGVRYRAIRRRTLSAPVGSDIPDGAIWSLEPHPDGEIVGTVGYSANLIDEGRIVQLVERYSDLLRAAVSDVDGRLDFGQ
jgi:hypothetical protein